MNTGTTTRNTLRALAVTVIAAFAVLTGGCSASLESSPSAGDPAVTGTVTAAVDTTTDDALDAVAFGETATYDDGLSVTVGLPTVFHVSETAVGHEPGNTPVRFTITITNGTKDTFDPIIAGASLTYGPDGLPAEGIFDSARDVSCGWTQPIRAGKRAQANCGFDVPPSGLADLQVEVHLGDVTHGSPLYVGSLKA